MISTSCRLSYNNLHVISYVVLDYHLAEFKHVFEDVNIARSASRLHKSVTLHEKSRSS